MRSVGARLAFWYALASTATMAGMFLCGRYFLEHYAIHSIDLLLRDEFTRVESILGPAYASLTPGQLQERLRGPAALESGLFYFDIRSRNGGTLFRSVNLGGRAFALIPAKRWDAIYGLASLFSWGFPPPPPDERFYNARLPDEPAEMRVAVFTLGSWEVTIATPKAALKQVMGGYLWIFVRLVAVMLVLSSAIGFFLSRLALRPVRLIQATANHISSDNLTERIPVSDVHDEISNLARLLNRMFDRLESSFNQIRRFTAEASHELKTPLSLVRLQAEKLLIEGGLSAAQEESVQVQLEEITRLNQIIEELLFLSRAEAGAITLAARSQDPRPFLQTFGQDARVLAEHRGRYFVERIDGAGTVEFDAKWIRQVLLNLLANGLSYSPPGGTIRLESVLADGRWRVAIVDEGPGVPPAQRERIFERFVRLEAPAGAQSGTGSGLGLAISRSIIGLHRGTIHAEEGADGKGLRVVFELAAVSVEGPSDPEPKAAALSS